MGRLGDRAGPAGLTAAVYVARYRRRVRGLYAAGDVVRGLNQIAVGAGEGAIAATTIHNQLRTRP